jgi:hypothetical protein
MSAGVSGVFLRGRFSRRYSQGGTGFGQSTAHIAAHTGVQRRADGVAISFVIANTPQPPISASPHFCGTLLRDGTAAPMASDGQAISLCNSGVPELMPSFSRLGALARARFAPCHSRGGTCFQSTLDVRGCDRPSRRAKAASVVLSGS